MEEKIEKKRRRTIVGFDPGTTSAIAVIDLDRNVLLLESVRNASFEEIVKMAGSAGKPIVVASDVAPAPEVVRKLAASFDSCLSVPEMSMEVEEKTRLAKSFTPYDNHQRDALAAAINSISRLSQLLEKAKNKGGEGWEDAFEKVLKGTKPNLSCRNERETTPPVMRRNRLPMALKLKVVMEREKKLRDAIEEQKATLLALKEENDRLRKNIELERDIRMRAIANARRHAAPHLISRIRNLEHLLEKKEGAMNSVMQKLRELEGHEVMILPAGRAIDGVLFVPVAGRKQSGAGGVVFAESGGGGGENVVNLDKTGGQRIDEWALVPKDSLSRLTKERLVGIIERYKKNREK